MNRDNRFYFSAPPRLCSTKPRRRRDAKFYTKHPDNKSKILYRNLDCLRYIWSIFDNPGFFMKTNSVSLYILAGVLTLAFFACTGNSADDQIAKEDTSTIDLNPEVVSAENVFVYVPSPIETANLLKIAGAKYDKNLLNGADGISHYSTSAAQALNLGVYGTDLAFAGIFEQQADIMMYMACTGKLAEALHISSAFSPDRHKRLENNMNNRDSVLSIITDSYWDCDAMLHENEQQHASALMIAGGWIEGLYLACKVAEKTNSNDIRIRIVEQRSSLDKLLVLLDKQKHADVKPVADELRGLKVLFDALPAPSSKSPSVTTDDASGVTTIGDDNSPAPVSLNSLEFKAITDEITRIRTGIINRN
jgi:hypothetical protein